MGRKYTEAQAAAAAGKTRAEFVKDALEEEMKRTGS